jgi:hypothetical protein
VILDRNSATTAMILADKVGQGDLHAGRRIWSHIEGWGAEPPPAASMNEVPGGRIGRPPTDPWRPPPPRRVQGCPATQVTMWCTTDSAARRAAA